MSGSAAAPSIMVYRVHQNATRLSISKVLQLLMRRISGPIHATATRRFLCPSCLSFSEIK
ncbi:hypothetical protein BDW75DRAFT_122808 [Aspergillus navahoensis]